MIVPANIANVPFVPFKLGAILTHTFVVVVLFTALGLSKSGNVFDLFVWHSFFLHPTFMTLAFGVFAPLGAVSWRVYYDFLGMRHDTVKQIHSTCTNLAAFFGFFGILDM